jgi:ABC-type bacteriocin/lantibiotic exporter with double-glycine peptidase domain
MPVPHYFQSSPQTCGAACLRMVCEPLGIVRDEATLVQLCGTTPLGCTIPDLIQGAQALGLGAATLPVSDRAAAAAALTQSCPFIAMVDLSSVYNTLPMFQWHFVVPLGAIGGEVTFHDPADGPDRRVPEADFLAGWATAGYRGVRIWTP